MSTKAERSRLGELLLDMRLVNEETLQSALAEQRSSGKHLATILAERRVLDEERLTKAVAARLGLEAVSLSSHKIHERVLALVPHAMARRYGILPIAIKRTQQAEVLYLVMVDPLNTEALGEVQRVTGRQVRVLMSSATELSQAIEGHYQAFEARQGAASAQSRRTPPPQLVGTPAAPPARTAPDRRRAASVAGAPPRPRGQSAVARPGPPVNGNGPARTPPRPPDLSGRPPVRPAPAQPAQAGFQKAEGSRPPDSRPPRPSDVSALGRPAEPAARPSPTGSRPGDLTARPSPSRPGDLAASQVPVVQGVRASEPALRAVPGSVRPSEPPARGAAQSPTTAPRIPSFPGPASDPSSRPGDGPVAPRGAPAKSESQLPYEPPPLMAPAKRPSAEHSALPSGAIQPAPFPAARLDLSNPATLIDTARPPEIQGLSSELDSLDDAPVIPSELDPPDSVSTRIDGPFDDLAAGARRGSSEPDWDLAVKDWGGDQAWQAPAAADPQRDLHSRAAPRQEGEHVEQVTALEDQWAQATGLDMGPPSQMRSQGDGEQEEIATSQLELSEASAAALRRMPPDPPPLTRNRRRLAATLEVPIELDEGPNPFDGPGPEEVPVGLDKTGIFPSVNLDDPNGFEPPPLHGEDSERDSQRGRDLAGMSDIPHSAEAVRARFADPPRTEEEPIEVIEEVVLEPLEEEPAVDAEPAPQRTSPPSPGLPLEALVQASDSDSESMPVIEPSSLVSLMDENAASADTGADAVPSMPPPRSPPLPTRVFDESNRLATPLPRGPAESTEEPTNPRFPAPQKELREAAPAERAPPAPSPARPEPVEAKPPPPPESPPPAAKVRAQPPASEEPTPARDALDRSDVLSALDGAFVRHETDEVDPPPAPTPPDPASAIPDEGLRMVDALMSGSSLDSAERAQVLLGLGRLLVDKGILTREELAATLVD